MSKTTKRLLSMTLALVMILSMVPTGVFHNHVHATTTEGDVITYDVGYGTKR